MNIALRNLIRNETYKILDELKLVNETVYKLRTDSVTVSVDSDNQKLVTLKADQGTKLTMTTEEFVKIARFLRKNGIITDKI
jgi:hypothetical protein